MIRFPRPGDPFRPGGDLRRRTTAHRTGFAWQFSLRRPDQTAAEDSHRQSSSLRTAKMARLEAVLFVAEGALSSRKLAQFATLADTAEVNELIERLNAAYDLAGAAFRIQRLATGFQLMTQPAFAYWLDKLHQRQSDLKLSPPAMETLTIVAYRQPITRADVEAVRGVQCAEMLKQLMDRGLVRIGGEDDSLGRPYLYETSRKFLELFGLRNLDDLPMAETLRKPASRPAPATTAGQETEAPDDAPANETDEAASTDAA